MGRVALSLFLTICLIGATHGTDCSYGTATNVFHKIAKTCPIPVVHQSDATYCCEGGCCNLVGYLFSGYRVIIIIVFTLIAVAILGITRCCTSCRIPGISCSVNKPVTPHSGSTGYPGAYK